MIGIHPVRDHPRLRGEQALAFVPSVCVVGSPPLARGTVRYFLFGPAKTRITPACAGNRILMALRACIRWDHPRLRGEQFARVMPAPYSTGSPPLARGTVLTRNAARINAGITPACAGNRSPTRLL